MPLPKSPHDMFFGDHPESQRMLDEDEIMIEPKGMPEISSEEAETIEPSEPNAVVVTASQPVVPALNDGSTAIMRLIERAAVDPSFDVTKLDQLLAVKDKWEANEARKAFVAAKAAFRAEAPTLDKDQRVGFDTQKGKTDYTHATLGNAAQALGPVLARHGFAYSWETEQLEGGLIRVTCVLTHALGHSERVSLQSGPDQSGSKNNIQAIGSTVTYLSRYTLLCVTGVATKEQDDDGRHVDTGGKISADQKDYLIEKLKETGAPTKKFLHFMGVTNIDDIAASTFPKAQRALEARLARA